MLTSRGRALAITLLVSSVDSPGLAQTKTPAGPRAPLSLPPARSELVQLDVVVNDKEGRPMADLNRSDFRVYEDGKVQPITRFEIARRPTLARGLASPARATPDEDQQPLAEAGSGPEPRFFVLAVDDLHTAAGSMAAARQAMLRFVDEQVSSDDYVALVTTSGSVGVHQDFTRDRASLRRAIEGVRSQYQPVEPGGAPYLSEHQAELIDRSDAEALRLAVEEVLQTEDYLGEIGAREKAYAQARRMVFEIMARSQRTLGTLEAVVRGLGPLRGRKNVVLLSDGFLVGLGAAENRSYDVRRIVDAATRSGVVLYALDTRGVVAEVPGGDAAFRGPGVLSAPGARQSLQARGREAQRQSLHALAEDTGGFLARETNDLTAGLGRVLRDNEVYYVLAYEPGNPARDGRFRRIEVRVPGRAGVRVRTRSGYFAADDRRLAEAEGSDPAQRRERELAHALASPFPLDGLPLRMSADFIHLPPAGAQAVIRARIDASEMPFVPSGDRFEADLEIVGAVYDESGHSVGDVSGEHAELRLTEASYRSVRSEGLTLQRTVPLRPGRYQVRMAVREGTRALLGSASQWLEIPDTAREEVTLSSVFLLADAGPGATDLTDVQAEKRFHPTQGMHYVVHVYGRAVTGCVLQGQVWQGSRLVGVTPRHGLAPDAAGGEGPAPVKWSERIALAGFAVGSYELRVLVTGRDGRVAAQRSVAFSIE